MSENVWNQSGMVYGRREWSKMSRKRIHTINCASNQIEWLMILCKVLSFLIMYCMSGVWIVVYVVLYFNVLLTVDDDDNLNHLNIWIFELLLSFFIIIVIIPQMPTLSHIFVHRNQYSAERQKADKWRKLWTTINNNCNHNYTW